MKRKRAKIGKKTEVSLKKYAVWKEESSRKGERKGKNHSLQ